MIAMIGLVLSAALVFLASRRVDLLQVKSSLTALRWWPWVPLAVTSYLLGHLARGVRCAGLLRGQASIGTVAATNIVIAARELARFAVVRIDVAVAAVTP